MKLKRGLKVWDAKYTPYHPWRVYVLTHTHTKRYKNDSEYNHYLGRLQHVITPQRRPELRQ